MATTDADEDAREEAEGEEMMLRFGKHFPTYLSGFDKASRPVFVFEFGKHAYTRIQPGPEEENFLKFLHHVMINKVGKSGDENPNGRVAFIVDFDGFSLSNVSSATALRILLRLYKYIRGMSSKIDYGFILNSSVAARIFLNTARPLVPEVMGKFEIYGTATETWIPAVLNKISAEQLGTQYGGVPNFRPLAFYG